MPKSRCRRKLIFALSLVVRSYWYRDSRGLGRGVALVWTNLKSETARRYTEKLRLKIPWSATRCGSWPSRGSAAFSHDAGQRVPLLQALKISKDATGSTLMADRIAEAAESVRDGKRLSEPLGAGGLFPEQILAMIVVAEESNKLDKVLLQIADTVERRTNRQSIRRCGWWSRPFCAWWRRALASWRWDCCCRSSPWRAPWARAEAPSRCI